jgi:hypothetical protein
MSLDGMGKGSDLGSLRRVISPRSVPDCPWVCLVLYREKMETTNWTGKTIGPRPDMSRDRIVSSSASPTIHVKVLISRTSECACIWRKGL